jgi:hypothetical protein
MTGDPAESATGEAPFYADRPPAHKLTPNRGFLCKTAWGRRTKKLAAAA